MNKHALKLKLNFTFPFRSCLCTSYDHAYFCRFVHMFLPQKIILGFVLSWLFNKNLQILFNIDNVPLQLLQMLSYRANHRHLIRHKTIARQWNHLYQSASICMSYCRSRWNEIDIQATTLVNNLCPKNSPPLTVRHPGFQLRAPEHFDGYEACKHNFASNQAWVLYNTSKLV